MMQLRIPVTDIKEEGLRVRCAFAADDVRPEGAESLPVTRAEMSGLLTVMGEEVLFRGRLSGAFQQQCDRCLESLELPFEVECTWFFEPDSGEEADDDDEVFRLDGEVVDLGHYAWEEMALAFPVRFVCPDDEPCQYRDRYMAQAAQEAAEGQMSPFAKLKELFPGESGDTNKE